MDELNWKWVYIPYLDAPDKQKESAIKAGYAKVYFKSEVDAIIARLEDKIQMHSFFWEGCGFEKRGFKNTIAVSEAFDRLEAENAELKQKLEDAGMRERRLRRALWKLKALYFYRMFQWSMEGKRLAPEDDEPEDFFMECMGKHTKRKSEWGNEADMFDDARIVCIKKAEEYKI